MQRKTVRAVIAKAAVGFDGTVIAVTWPMRMPKMSMKAAGANSSVLQTSTEK